MRNLKYAKFSIWNPPTEYQTRSITATACEPGTSSYICTFGPSEHDALVELVRVTDQKGSDKHELISAWDAPSPDPSLLCDRISSLQYFTDSSTACLVFAGGDIVAVREQPLFGEERIEIVGSVDAGVTAAEWSPDGELLAMTTKAGTVVFMSRSFESVMDVAMTTDDLKAFNNVSVGWGKRETQFQGKGAKALRDPTIPETVDEGTLSGLDNGEATISWRGDGAYLAISTIQDDSRRLVRVYSRDGVLDSVTEPVDGLEGALSWRPAGNLIAGIQRLSDHVDVVFFERNGLRHGQFSLRLNTEQLQSSNRPIRLVWNSDSTVLAVILADRVQFWTMGNYHWYLKQELLVGNIKVGEPLLLIWHPEKPLKFWISVPDYIISAEYVLSITRSSILPPNDSGSVAVIDGKILKVTPFRSANVPPPMALYDIDVGHNIIDVSFSSGGSFISVLHEGGLSVFHWNTAGNSSQSPKLVGCYPFENYTAKPRFPQHVVFGENNSLWILEHRGGQFAALSSYEFNDDTGRMVSIPSPPFTPKTILLVSSFDDGKSMHPFAQDESGDLYSLIKGNESLAKCRFPIFLPWVEIATYEGGYIAFGLSNTGHLYANSRLLVKNCSSFLLTPAHLIFTTLNHFLKFVHITSSDALNVPPDDPETDERCRSIERGARLVTATPTSLSLVLQMPRGNLETIWPRAMVVAGIRKLIDEKNYRGAFMHCRTQRVDMNILYDHAPEQFINNVALFIDQVKKISYIDLFLSGLRDEDVTQSMYKETRVQAKVEIEGISQTVMANSSILSAPKSTNKINHICDAMLNVFTTRTATNLQNIVTAHVCKSPPALEDGLQLIVKLMNENEAMADEAVEHICFLADVNRLFDSALGLYNLDLALLIAQQSQKDPREYLPFLQDLQEMNHLRRQFSIDDHLSRHNKALSHLFELSKDDSAELEAYTVNHSLYQDALKLYRHKEVQLKQITQLYAVYLVSQSKFHEAAVAYEFLSNANEATACYQRAGPTYWQECLFCASQQKPPVSGEALLALSNSLAESLVEVKDFQSAALIHLNYLSSPSTACNLLCKGYHFATAFRIASLHQPDLLTSNGLIDTGLTDSLSSSTELLAECKAQLQAQVPRILELRAIATTDPLAFYEGQANDDIPDDISVAASSRLSTSASLFTRYTGRHSQGTAVTGASRQTSKNRRREERKRARGKKGSVYEEEYLVASVSRLLERLESVREDIKNLVVALVRRSMRERALAVESLLCEVLQMCADAIEKVYESSKIADVEVARLSFQNGYKPVGGDAVLVESLQDASKQKTPPTIGAFEKLSILGS